MSDDLRFRQENLGDSVKLSLSGEVDIYTSQELKENL
ncbi:MAG TPA: anti-sigma factor antagonist, partial [Clostridiaceae bacterium]|nr:anti-sigma factor antagonist [Clostridiaceae bacterium]